MCNIIIFLCFVVINKCSHLSFLYFDAFISYYDYCLFICFAISLSFKTRYRLRNQHYFNMKSLIFLKENFFSLENRIIKSYSFFEICVKLVNSSFCLRFFFLYLIHHVDLITLFIRLYKIHPSYRKHLKQLIILISCFMKYCCFIGV